VTDERHEKQGSWFPSHDLNGRFAYEAGAAATEATFGRDIGIKMMSDSKYFEGERKVFPVHAMKAYRGCGVIAPPILNLGAIWR
jgi:hypothetical protein